MSRKAHGQMRRGQVISTWGPGALLDLPRYSVIVGGLDTWPMISDLEEITDPLLIRKLKNLTGISSPRMYAPPASSNDPREPESGIGAWRFPEWFVVQEENRSGELELSRRLVHRKALDKQGRFEKLPVVPTRFVRACPKGHIDDLDWYGYVHGPDQPCRRQLWLDERGTSGDLSDLIVRCECGKQRALRDATHLELIPLGMCLGRRPWLGSQTGEGCTLPSRLLIRTAANAYFPQLISVLSLPARGSALHSIVTELWDDLQIVETAAELNLLKKKPKITEKLSKYSDKEVIEAINEKKKGKRTEEPVKQVELDALLAAPEGFGDDVPLDPDFHARRMPERIWRHSEISKGIESVIQLHRLREVRALLGFTRFEGVTPDIHGEYDTDVETASLALDPQWFPAVENRGEGILVQLRSKSVRDWMETSQERVNDLQRGHKRWVDSKTSKRNVQFPGGPYILLHTLSHLLIQSLALRCGYPASSIRERIYSDGLGDRYALLLYTGSPDAEGTLGGLVQEARHIEDHLAHALRMAALCSNDPICAQHSPGESMEGRWLHGAACHGCALIAETSCEMRNDYLDRALVVPVLGRSEAAFFKGLS